MTLIILSSDYPVPPIGSHGVFWCGLSYHQLHSWRHGPLVSRWTNPRFFVSILIIIHKERIEGGGRSRVLLYNKPTINWRSQFALICYTKHKWAFPVRSCISNPSINGRSPFGLIWYANSYPVVVLTISPYLKKW